MNKKIAHRLNLIYCIAFFIVLLIPTFVLKLKGKNETSCEKRTILKCPPFKFNDKYLEKFGKYYEDNYGLRNEFTFWQAQIKLNLFNSSSNSDQVLPGKDGWLFYNSQSDSSYGCYSRTNLLPDKSLFKFKKTHENRKQKLAKRNIQYLLAVWPDKATIYPEYLPFQMSIQIEDTTSKLDQILKFLKKEHSKIELIDVRKEILSKKQKQLYLKHDTHWNALGAFYGYSAFLNKTQNVLHERPYKLSDFKISDVITHGGDLLDALGLCDKSNDVESVPVFEFKKKWEIVDDKEFWGSQGTHNLNATSNLKVLFFRDSFGKALMQFFSLHFKDVYFYWSEYDQKIVDMIKPDVVIVCKTERHM